MDPKDEKYLILEQYRIYSDAKEKFIDRNFSTNRFFLVLNIAILITTYILSTLTPQYHAVLILCIIGFVATLMWYMNIDSYETLIKVKYAKVLEYLETKLPEQPYHKEFIDYREMKKNKNLIVFGNFQKTLAFAISLIYLVAFTYSLTNMIRFQLF